jgi:hypothetical protein
LLKTVPRRGYVFTAEVIKRPAKLHQFSITDPDSKLSPVEIAGAKVARVKVAGKHNNLPVPRTSLIGREQQVADASELLLRGTFGC